MSYEFEQPFVLDTIKYQSTFDTAGYPARHGHHRHRRLVPEQGEFAMTMSEAPTAAELSPSAAWSERVRRVGGFIQLAFAAFWLVRGGLIIGGVSGTILTGGCDRHRRGGFDLRHPRHRSDRPTAHWP